MAASYRRQLSARHKKNRLSHDIRFSKTNYLKTNLLKQIKKSSLLLASLINWWQSYNKKLLPQNFFRVFFLKNTKDLKCVTFVIMKRAKRQRFGFTLEVLTQNGAVARRVAVQPSHGRHCFVGCSPFVCRYKHGNKPDLYFYDVLKLVPIVPIVPKCLIGTNYVKTVKKVFLGVFCSLVPIRHFGTIGTIGTNFRPCGRS